MLSAMTEDRNLLLRRALRTADLSEPPDRRELRAAVRGYLAKTAGESLVGVRSDPGTQPADVSAERDGERWRLTGRTDFVLDAAAADVLLAVAATPEGPGLFACDPADVACAPMVTLDLTRRQSA